MASAFDLEELVHLEQTFYDVGYADGFAHGRIHGLIEGRALGHEKGFEIWEEIGFYEGFARAWQAIGTRYPRQRDNCNDQRIAHHTQHLLDLIQRFPQMNPHVGHISGSGEGPDMEKLQRQIRSRYKTLCASLGTRPTLRAGGSIEDVATRGEHGPSEDGEEGVDVSAVRHTMSQKVWALEEDANRQVAHALSF